MRDSVRRHRDWLETINRIALNFAAYRKDFDRADFLYKCDAISKDTAKFFALTEKK